MGMFGLRPGTHLAGQKVVGWLFGWRPDDETSSLALILLARLLA